MKIQGNESLVKYRAEVDELQQKFATELELINASFNPDFIKLKNKRGNLIYYLVMTLFLFIFISLTVFLRIVEAYYFILLLYAVNLALSIIGFIFLKKTDKLFKETKKLWDIEYERVLKYKDEINDIYLKIEDEVYKVITLSTYYLELQLIKDSPSEYEKFFKEKENQVREEIKESLGNSFTTEGVLRYYLRWGEELTQVKSDYDYLEARRRKAQLQSKKIDIDNDKKD